MRRQTPSSPSSDIIQCVRCIARGVGGPVGQGIRAAARVRRVRLIQTSTPRFNALAPVEALQPQPTSKEWENTNLDTRKCVPPKDHCAARGKKKEPVRKNSDFRKKYFLRIQTRHHCISLSAPDHAQQLLYTNSLTHVPWLSPYLLPLDDKPCGALAAGAAARGVGEPPSQQPVGRLEPAAAPVRGAAT